MIAVLYFPMQKHKSIDFGRGVDAEREKREKKGKKGKKEKNEKKRKKGRDPSAANCPFGGAFAPSAKGVVPGGNSKGQLAHRRGNSPCSQPALS